MKIAVIIQARMGSTRLPGKVMKKLKGKTVLAHVLERVGKSRLIDEVIVATTTHERDDCLEKEAKRLGVTVYRGSETDVLSRYYDAAKENGVGTIIRITSDCPLIDPKIMDAMIEVFKKGSYDLVTNVAPDPSQRTFPRGMDTEIFSVQALERAFFNGNERYHREHVTPYMYEQSKKIYFYKNKDDYSDYRLTLDTKEDFQLIEQIYDRLFDGTHDFYLSEIIELFQREPELLKINAHIEQKEIK